MDIKVFIDTALDICFIRRLQRDIKERNRSVDNIIKQYNETVRPMYSQFIEPSKRHAHIIIPRGGKNLVAIDILTTKIKSLLQEQDIS
jgi:uridine kinase